MNFKVGDKVVAYGVKYTDAFYSRLEGVVQDVDGFVSGDGLIAIKNDMYKIDHAWVHPKQCRLLKKKERRRVWIHKVIFENEPKGREFKCYEGEMYIDAPRDNENGWIEFIEVKKK